MSGTQEDSSRSLTILRENVSNGPTAAPAPVLGGISEAELDAIVAQLRTDKNLTVAPVPVASERLGALTEQLLLSTPGTLSLFESEVARDEAARQDWYISLNERVTGPLSVSALRGHWERGELSPDSLCWRKGFEGWRRVCQIPGLAEFLAPRPATAPSKPEELVPDPRAGALDFPLKGAEGLRILAADVPPPLPAKGPEHLPPVLEPEPVTAPMLEPEPDTVPEAPQARDAAGAHPILSAQAPTHVEVRLRGGVWLALGGGLVGGMLVAIVVWLLGLLPSSGTAGSSASAASSTLAKVAAPLAPTVTTPTATASATPTVTPTSTANTVTPPAAVASTPAATPPASAIAADSARVQVPGTAPVRAPSLGLDSTRVPAIGAVSALGNAASAVTAPRAPAPVSRATPVVSETVQAAKSVEAPVRKVQQDPSMQRLAKAELPAQPEPSARKSVASQAAAEETEEDSEDLEFDKEFARELDDPSKRAVPAKRTVWIPPDPKPVETAASLTQSDIFSVVVANKGDITSCVSAQKLQSEEGTRKVVLSWSILPSGKVTDVVTETAEYRGTPLALCLEGKVRAWTFPKHREQGGPVRFPFVF
jgi:hypothetical protein